MYLVQVNGAKLLLECGLFQGRRGESIERNCCFPFNPAELDAARSLLAALLDRLERAVEDFVIEAPNDNPPIVGRLVATGLHDELSGEAYAIVDGVDGRAGHIRFNDIEAFEHAPPPGGIVELRRFGVFSVKPRKTGIGRNPRTGQEVSIPPGKAVRFKPGKELQALP